MKNITKLKKLMASLDKEGISYKVYDNSKAARIGKGHCDLYISNPYVCVKIQGEDDDLFYSKHRHCHPVFIRDNETPKFIIEKVRNAIIDAMLKQQKHYLRKSTKNESN